jgi:hypothetical protein
MQKYKAQIFAHPIPNLKNGLIWCIGDGKDIRVWQDKWLPTPTSFSIQSPRRLLSEDARVVELIDQDTKWWNANLIREIFHAEEAQVIQQIPLSPQLPKEVLIWRCIKNGIFSVRSAYHMDKDLQNMRRGEGSKQGDGDLVWKTLWKLNVPNVVKMFIWRACNDLLPT